MEDTILNRNLILSLTSSLRSDGAKRAGNMLEVESDHRNNVSLRQ